MELVGVPISKPSAARSSDIRPADPLMLLALATMTTAPSVTISGTAVVVVSSTVVVVTAGAAVVSTDASVVVVTTSAASSPPHAATTEPQIATATTARVRSATPLDTLTFLTAIPLQYRVQRGRPIRANESEGKGDTVHFIMSTSIPVIDLQQPDDVVTSSIIEAYSQIGFAQIIGHGVAQPTIDAAFDASARFHALELDEKMAIALDHNHRGYIADGTAVDRSSEVVPATAANRSESFMMMRDDTPDSREVALRTPLDGANQWPHLDNFREPVTRCHDAMRDVALTVLTLIDHGLGAEGALIDTFSTPTTWFRLLHYPPVMVDAPEDVFGSAPHTDFGALTLVAQDSAGGLQVAKGGDEWIDVEPIDGAFVMNAGSMLHRWSNGRLRATPHWVRNRGNSDRYSCVLFCDPHMLTEIAPLPACVGGDGPLFEPVVFTDVVAHHLGAIYEQHQH